MRQFQSESGLPVPLILPDYSAPWHKLFPKLSTSINSSMTVNIESCRDEIEEQIRKSEAIEPNTKNVSSASETPVGDNHNGVWSLLGMKAYKTPNNTQSVFNILSKSPTDKI